MSKRKTVPGVYCTQCDTVFTNDTLLKEIECPECNKVGTLKKHSKVETLSGLVCSGACCTQCDSTFTWMTLKKEGKCPECNEMGTLKRTQVSPA